MSGDKPIKARSAEGLRAYMDGYAAAMNDVSDYGWEVAKNYLAAMAEATGAMSREQIDRARAKANR